MGISPVPFWLTIAAAYAVYIFVQRASVVQRNTLLLAASYVFCFMLDPAALVYLLGSTVATYFGGIAAERRRPGGKYIGLLVIGAHVALIVAWKAAALFLETFPALRWMAPSFIPGAMMSVVVPLGLSYYTFQSIAYVTDILHGEDRAERNLLHFALFQAFFPKLASGPIERAQYFLPQIRELRPIRRDDIAEGIFLVTWGAVKKFALAAIVARVADAFFANPYTLGYTNIIGVIAFALQLYADFSGYTDMARGIARLLGFRLAQNFRFPFAAAAPDDFWSRWHISLSQWVRDYIYIPLGGNRKGATRAAFHALLAMIVVGCWHGITPMFVLWGVFHGLLTISHRIWRQYFHAPKWVAIPSFFTINLFGWMLFRSPTMESFMIMLQEVFASPWQNIPQPIAFALPIVLGTAVALFAVEQWQSRKQEGAVVAQSSWLELLTFAVFAFYALFLGAPMHIAPFIYANF